MAAGVLAAGITAGAQLGGQLLNQRASKKQQRRQNRYNTEMWHMQNEYNSPQAQMKRLQEAGLNPNLVYGQSSGGAAGQAERLQSAEFSKESTQGLDMSHLAPTLGSFADMAVKNAQVDKLKSATQLDQENIVLAAQKSYGEGLRNSKTHLDVQLNEDLYHTNLDMAKERLRRLKLDVGHTEINISQQKERLKQMGYDTQLKRLDAQMAKMGIRPNDPFYATALQNLINVASQKLTGKKFNLYRTP